MRDFDGFLKRELRLLRALEPRQRNALCNERISEETLMPTLLQNPHRILRNRLGVFVLFLRDENLRTCLIDLCYADLVSDDVTYPPGLSQILVRFFIARQVKENKTNIILDAGAEGTIPGQLELVISFFKFAYCTPQILFFL